MNCPICGRKAPVQQSQFRQGHSGPTCDWCGIVFIEGSDVWRDCRYLKLGPPMPVALSPEQVESFKLLLKVVPESVRPDLEKMIVSHELLRKLLKQTQQEKHEANLDHADSH